MNADHPRFSDRLVAAEPLSPSSREQLQQELHAMFEKELTGVRRGAYGVVALAAAASTLLCGFLVFTEPDLPPVPRTALAVGALFGLAWTIVAARIWRRGSYNARHDARRIAAMVWTFTVLMMVFFLIAGMSANDRFLGLMMIANGLVFLICAGVYWLSYRIEAGELNTREKLLQIELQLAELCEKR